MAKQPKPPSDLELLFVLFLVAKSLTFAETRKCVIYCDTPLNILYIKSLLNREYHREQRNVDIHCSLKYVNASILVFPLLNYHEFSVFPSPTFLNLVKPATAIYGHKSF